MGLSDLLHSALVLGTTASYGFPLYEAIQRRSTFYTLTFAVITTLSFALHCEESGLCAPYAADFHARLQIVSQGLSYFLLGLMILVTFEIRNDFVARTVCALFAIGVTVRDVADVRFNVGGMLVVGLLLLVMDVFLFKRTFTAAYWQRLGVIAVMAAVGAAIFRLVHSFWWHGVWHVYLAGCIYLLLLAQRTKRMLARHTHDRGRGHSAAGFSSSVIEGAGMTTPLKRKFGPSSATAATMDEGGAGPAGGGGSATGASGSSGSGSARGESHDWEFRTEGAGGGGGGGGHHGHSHGPGGHSHSHGSGASGAGGAAQIV